MAYDANQTLQASQTVTATTTSAALAIPSGTPRRGLKARVVVTAISGTAASVGFKLQHSADNIAWYDLSNELAVNPLTAVGADYIPFETSNGYVRLVATVAGTTPSVTYHAEIGAARP